MGLAWLAAVSDKKQWNFSEFSPSHLLARERHYHQTECSCRSRNKSRIQEVAELILFSPTFYAGTHLRKNRGAEARLHCIPPYINRTSPSDSSKDRWKRLCLVHWAASPCVGTLRVLTRNLLTYLLTYLLWPLRGSPTQLCTIGWRADGSHWPVFKSKSRREFFSSIRLADVLWD